MVEQSRKVLIVEDEPDLCRAYQRYFRTRYGLAFAGSGAEAMTLMAAFEPDVVVLDMHLPDTDGIDLLKRIREVRPTIPVVITTAYLSIEPLMQVMGVGYSGHLLKPFPLEQLAGLIDAAV